MADALFSDHIPLMRPWLGEEEAQAVREVILSGWVSQGPKVAEFERQIAALVGARHAIATNAATTALHLMMQVLGIRPGDEVILPAFTCMANANAVIIAGAVPVFADIQRDSYNLDPEDVARRITARTRGVMVVDQIGLPADLDAFKALAGQRDLLLFEDAATALGARYRGRYLGGHGVPAVFSFHPRKVIATGEGGMLVIDDDAQAERAQVLRATGASISDLKRHEAKGALFQQYFEYGYNYRLTDMQAAMGIVQLTKLERILAARRDQARRYQDLLGPIDEIRPPFEPDYARSAYSSYCVRLQPSARVGADEVVQRMARYNVSCRRGIQPLHHEPYFASTMSGLRLPETEAAARDTLFLPIFPGLTDAEQVQVVERLKQSLLP